MPFVFLFSPIKFFELLGEFLLKYWLSKSQFYVEVEPANCIIAWHQRKPFSLSNVDMGCFTRFGTICTIKNLKTPVEKCYFWSKCNTPPWMFFTFLTLYIGTKSRKTSHIVFEPKQNIETSHSTELSYFSRRK